MNEDINLKTYTDPAVVAAYAKMEKLAPCEEVLFQRWIRPGATVLDLGVGAGARRGLCRRWPAAILDLIIRRAWWRPAGRAIRSSNSTMATRPI